MTSLNRNVLLPVVAGIIALVSMGAAQAQDERGRVISSTPLIQQVMVPREVCQNVTVREQARTSGAGALMGGIAGGAMGNAIGGGSGRAVATAIGLFGGAVLGNRIEGRGPDTLRTVQECSTQNSYQNQTVGYDVVYEYAGRRYNTQMDREPGRYVPVTVMPNVRPGYRPQVNYQTQRAEPDVVYVGGQRRNQDRYERDDDDDDQWDRNWR